MQDVAIAWTPSSLNRIETHSTFIFSLAVRFDSSPVAYFVLPPHAPQNLLLTYFGTTATQFRRLNPEVSLVTFLPMHLQKGTSFHSL